MKFEYVEQPEKFKPFSITVQSKEELMVLFALSNVTVNEAKENSNQLGFTLPESSRSIIEKVFDGLSVKYQELVND